MSLNDLLPLLFVIALVVNAVVRGRQAQRRKGPRPGETTPPARDTGDRRTAAEAPRPEDAPSRGDAGGPPGDELRSRIEEARRRVREAMGEAEEAPRREPARGQRGPSVTGAGPTTSPTTGGMAPGSMFSGPRPTPDAPRAEVDSFLGREGVRRPPAERVAEVTSRAPTVTRLGAPPGSARLRAAKGLGTSRSDIVRGFVWSVVFEDPVAIRMRRRTVSPRR